MTFGQKDAYWNNKRRDESKKSENKQWCNNCEKEIEHIIESGHDGRDSWINSYCAVCGE